MDDVQRRAAERRRRAAEWPLRRYRLGEEPKRDWPDSSSVEDRIGAVWPLTREGWAVAGREIPTYDRSSMPGRLARRERR